MTDRVCFIVPPHITRRLPRPNRTADLGHDDAIRTLRRQARQVAAPATAPGVTVYDAKHRQATTSTTLCTDADAGNVTAGLDAAEQLWASQRVQVFPALAFAHYGRDYDNAFWDGQEMVFGDGDGQVFGDFTVPVDVCVHERTHGVTGDRLDYQDQAGALNESMSDIAGAVARQTAGGMTTTSPTAWLIGAGLILEPGARALRDMLNPGTAYDTPNLGRDPQPTTMAGYDDDPSDNGGVHLNSSIPNRAFALAAVELADAGLVFAVWADVLLHTHYPADCTFRQWAQLTVDRSTGPVQAAIVRGWRTVGVPVDAPADPAPTPAPTPTDDSASDRALALVLRRLLATKLVPAYFRRIAQQWLDQHP